MTGESETSVEQQCARCELGFEGDFGRIFCDDCHEAMAAQYVDEPNPRAQEIGAPGPFAYETGEQVTVVVGVEVTLNVARPMTQGELVDLAVGVVREEPWDHHNEARFAHAKVERRESPNYCAECGDLVWQWPEAMGTNPGLCGGCTAESYGLGGDDEHAE